MVQTQRYKIIRIVAWVVIAIAILKLLENQSYLNPIIVSVIAINLGLFIIFKIDVEEEINCNQEDDFNEEVKQDINLPPPSLSSSKKEEQQLINGLQGISKSQEQFKVKQETKIKRYILSKKKSRSRSKSPLKRKKTNV